MSEKLFALLLQLYPARFRREYGGQAVQLLHDRLRDERGFFPRLRLWLDLLVDVGSSLPREYRRVPSALGSARTQPHTEVPSFHVLDDRPPGPATFLFGAVLALAASGVFGFLLNRGGENKPISALSARASGTAQSSDRQPISRSGGSPIRHSTEEFKLDDAERRLVITAVIANLREHYVDRGSAQKVAEVLSAREENGDYSAIISGDVFAGVLTWQVRNTSQDRRLMVIYSGDRIRAGSPPVSTVHRIDDHFAITIPEAP